MFPNHHIDLRFKAKIAANELNAFPMPLSLYIDKMQLLHTGALPLLLIE